MRKRLKTFEMPNADIEAAIRVCAALSKARRATAARGTVIRLPTPAAPRAAPHARLDPEAALAA